MARPRLLVATCDGAGSLDPILALSSTLQQSGYDVSILAHDAQQARITAAGLAFVRYETALQFDHADPATFGSDAGTTLATFTLQAADDVARVAARLAPAAVLVDCLMPEALTAMRASGTPVVALVHVPYRFVVGAAGGRFREPVDRADLALCFSYTQFDLEPPPPNLIFAGPLRPEAASMTFERRFPQRPLVVASLSTGVQGVAGTQADLLLRVCDALAELDVEAVVTTGRGIAPEGITRAENTSVVRSIPHETVLPGAALFITHAGHGSVMAALRFGTPMLCFPRVADQPVNALNVARHRLGVVFDPESSRPAIRDAVRQLLNNAVLLENTRAFAAQLPAPDARAAVAAVDTLLAR